jgi:hypothetical protein
MLADATFDDQAPPASSGRRRRAQLRTSFEFRVSAFAVAPTGSCEEFLYLIKNQRHLVQPMTTMPQASEVGQAASALVVAWL